MNRFLSTATVLAVCCLVGCSRSFDATYGPSAGISGRNSVNGFGALRSSYENAGFETREVYRLTERTRRSDVVVWTPTVMKSTDIRVTRWFERWLREGGKTLVYIVPDSGSEANYWVQAGQTAPPKQRMEYRRRAARKLNERLNWTINRQASFTNGWFVIQPKAEIFQRGKLSTENWDMASQVSDENASPTILTEYVIEPFSTDDTNGSKGTTPAAVVNNGPTGPAAPYSPYASEEVTTTEVDFEPLVKTESGEAIVAEITSDRWADSRILVVAGGSLLTNFAFTQPVSVQLAEQLITQSQPNVDVSSTETDNKKIAGFLLSSYNPIPVSERQTGVPQASGMELLTVWPISLVTIHAVLLGFIVCMMLLPIFGRPRKVNRGSTSNFGDHLDAVASLMSNARGEKYARGRISEYMRRVKGETNGEWVIEDAPKPTIVPPLTPAATVPPTNDQSDDQANDPHRKPTNVSSNAPSTLVDPLLDVSVGPASAGPDTESPANDDSGAPVDPQKSASRPGDDLTLYT